MKSLTKPVLTAQICVAPAETNSGQINWNLFKPSNTSEVVFLLTCICSLQLGDKAQMTCSLTLQTTVVRFSKLTVFPCIPSTATLICCTEIPESQSLKERISSMYGSLTPCSASRKCVQKKKAAPKTFWGSLYSKDTINFKKPCDTIHGLILHTHRSSYLPALPA